MDKANISYYEQSKNDKEKASNNKNIKYKYAVIIYKQYPWILIKNINEKNDNILGVFLFKNLQKRKLFLKLHNKINSRYFEYIKMKAKIKNDRLIYEV